MKTVRFKYVLNEIIKETEEFLNLNYSFLLVEAIVIERYNGKQIQTGFYTAANDRKQSFQSCINSVQTIW